MMLPYVDSDKPFILTTDASDYAIVVSLSQLNDKSEEQIVCFVSQTLKVSESNYFILEKELIAVVWSLHKLESHLKGSKKITVRTDHQAVTFLNMSRFNNAGIMRWSLSIQDFDIELEHIEGKENCSADYLSRQMHPNSNWKNDSDIMISAVNKIELKKETVKLIKGLVNSQKSDEYCQKIKIRLENKDKSIVDIYKIQNDLLYKIINTVNKVIFLIEFWYHL